VRSGKAATRLSPWLQRRCDDLRRAVNQPPAGPLMAPSGATICEMLRPDTGLSENGAKRRQLRPAVQINNRLSAQKRNG
jgi:hypothetical protein